MTKEEMFRRVQAAEHTTSGLSYRDVATEDRAVLQLLEMQGFVRIDTRGPGWPLQVWTTPKGRTYYG